MKITKNFSLDEFLNSQTAKSNNIEEQFTPPQEVINNITTLCGELLQPIRDAYGKSIKISSGYRCARLNKLVGGAKNSQHLFGQAADIQSDNNKELLDFIKDKFDYDQLLSEYPDRNGVPKWVHISYKSKKDNRKQFLVIK